MHTVLYCGKSGFRPYPLCPITNLLSFLRSKQMKISIFRAATSLLRLNTINWQEDLDVLPTKILSCDRWGMSLRLIHIFAPAHRDILMYV